MQPDSFTFEGITGADWKECYNIASQQGILALAWEGVLLLPKELQPPKPLMLQWGLSVEKYEVKHRRYCAVAEELQQLYREQDSCAGLPQAPRGPGGG